MSMHLIPLTPLERAGLGAHGLKIGTPSQLADGFRQGVRYAVEFDPGRKVMLEYLTKEYARLADIRNSWPGRDTPEGQRKLCDLRDLIATATGQEQQTVQDRYSCPPPSVLKEQPETNSAPTPLPDEDDARFLANLLRQRSATQLEHSLTAWKSATQLEFKRYLIDTLNQNSLPLDKFRLAVHAKLVEYHKDQCAQLKAWIGQHKAAARVPAALAEDCHVYDATKD